MINKKGKEGISRRKGFTLVEMLVVIGLIALLSTVVLVAVNPARQFQSARDATRHAHLSALLNSISQNITEHQGVFACNGSPLSFPSSTTTIGSGVGEFDLEECIIPTYLSAMPADPNEGEYAIKEDANGHLTLIAESEVNPGSKILLTR